MADKAVENNSNNKKDRRPLIAASVISVLLIIGVAVFIIVGTYTKVADAVTQSAQYLKLPTISKTIKGSDGKAHSLDIDISLEQNSESGNELDSEALMKKLEDVVANLDYDKLSEPGNVDYIKTTVRESLNDFLGANEITNVYLGNIVIDFPGAINAETTIGSPMKGLFKSLNKTRTAGF